MYVKPNVVTLTKEELINLVKIKGSCGAGSGYCSNGAIYCSKKASHSDNCPSDRIFCSGGSYSGTQETGERI